MGLLSRICGVILVPESSQVVIKGNFHGVEGTKAVGPSGNYSNFVVEALNGAVGDFSFGPKPIQYQRLMCAQHPGHLFHWFQTAPHGPETPSWLTVWYPLSCPNPEQHQSTVQVIGQHRQSESSVCDL
jgi:hypothetical protein